MSDENKSKDVKIKLLGVRIAFTDALFEAKAFKAGDKKRFSTKFLIPKDSPMAALVKEAILKAAVSEFKEDASKTLVRLKAENKLCLTDGEVKDYDGYAGNYVLSASNKTRPLILGPNKEPLTEKDGKIYSGCYVNAIVSVWPQNNDWGQRINCNLQGVQFVADGEAFSGGGVASADEFDNVEGAAATTMAADNASFM